MLLTFVLSLVTTIGWWAVANLLDRHVTILARGAGYAKPELWGTWAALVYTLGAVVAYLLSGFVIDALGRRLFLFLAYLGSLVMVPVTYWLLRSPEAVIASGFVNGFFTLGWAYSWMAIYPSELFTSSVRSTAASFIFNATRLLAWIFPIAAGTMIQSLRRYPANGVDPRLGLRGRPGGAVVSAGDQGAAIAGVRVSVRGEEDLQRRSGRLSGARHRAVATASAPAG